MAKKSKDKDSERQGQERRDSHSAVHENPSSESAPVAETSTFGASQTGMSSQGSTFGSYGSYSAGAGRMGGAGMGYGYVPAYVPETKSAPAASTPVAEPAATTAPAIKTPVTTPSSAATVPDVAMPFVPASGGSGVAVSVEPASAGVAPAASVAAPSMPGVGSASMPGVGGVGPVAAPEIASTTPLDGHAPAELHAVSPNPVTAPVGGATVAAPTTGGQPSVGAPTSPRVASTLDSNPVVDTVDPITVPGGTTGGTPTTGATGGTTAPAAGSTTTSASGGIAEPKVGGAASDNMTTPASDSIDVPSVPSVDGTDSVATPETVPTTPPDDYVFANSTFGLKPETLPGEQFGRDDLTPPDVTPTANPDLRNDLGDVITVPGGTTNDGVTDGTISTNDGVTGSTTTTGVTDQPSTGTIDGTVQRGDGTDGGVDQPDGGTGDHPDNPDDGDGQTDRPGDDADADETNGGRISDSDEFERHSGDPDHRWRRYDHDDQQERHDHHDRDYHGRHEGDPKVEGDESDDSDDEDSGSFGWAVVPGVAGGAAIGAIHNHRQEQDSDSGWHKGWHRGTSGEGGGSWSDRHSVDPTVAHDGLVTDAGTGEVSTDSPSARGSHARGGSTAPANGEPTPSAGQAGTTSNAEAGETGSSAGQAGTTSNATAGETDSSAEPAGTSEPAGDESSSGTEPTGPTSNPAAGENDPHAEGSFSANTTPTDDSSTGHVGFGDVAAAIGTGAVAGGIAGAVNTSTAHAATMPDAPDPKPVDMPNVSGPHTGHAPVDGPRVTTPDMPDVQTQPAAPGAPGDWGHGSADMHEDVSTTTPAGGIGARGWKDGDRTREDAGQIDGTYVTKTGTIVSDGRVVYLSTADFETIIDQAQEVADRARGLEYRLRRAQTATETDWVGKGGDEYRLLADDNNQVMHAVADKFQRCVDDLKLALEKYRGADQQSARNNKATTPVTQASGTVPEGNGPHQHHHGGNGHGHGHGHGASARRL